MNANDATLTALTTTQTGNGAASNAPNAPAAASFDLVLTAVAGGTLGSSGAPYTLTISAIDLTAVSQGWPTQTLHQAFDAASGWKPSGTVMQDYLDALVKRADFPTYFTDDIVATFEGTDQRADGRDAAAQLIRHVRQGAFGARVELKNLLTDDGKAAIEADFADTHTGEFAEIPPTGRPSASPTRSSTTCAATISARYASTSP